MHRRRRTMRKQYRGISTTHRQRKLHIHSLFFYFILIDLDLNLKIQKGLSCDPLQRNYANCKYNFVLCFTIHYNALFVKATISRTLILPIRVAHSTCTRARFSFDFSFFFFCFFLSRFVFVLNVQFDLSLRRILHVARSYHDNLYADIILRKK